MKTIVITGSQGFVGSYLCREFLNNGYKVIGIDNYSKYGYVKRSHDDHHNFKLYIYDIRKFLHDSQPIADVVFHPDIDTVIACASEVGGVEYLNSKHFDLLANNNNIMQATCQLANLTFANLLVISSTMAGLDTIYGFQKLSCEYYAKAIALQYELPYSIARISNVVGIGEEPTGAKYSHVIPDLIRKIMIDKQDPVEILGSGMQSRCYTNGKDIATGIRLIAERSGFKGETYDILNGSIRSVLEVASMIIDKVRPKSDHRFTTLPCFKGDPQHNHGNTKKAKEELGFEAKISLSESIDEVIAYIKETTKP